MDRYHFIDYYKVLSVEKDASKQEIEESYQLIAFRYKTKDILPESEDADERYALLEKAYDVLTDTKEKKEYDKIYDEVYQRVKQSETGIPKLQNRKREKLIRNMIYLVIAILILSISLLTVLNREEKTEKPVEVLAGDDGVFKVALLVPNTITDGGWAESAYQGLMQIEKELGAEIVYAEAATEEEIVSIARQYGEENYDLIIGHGEQYSIYFKDISPKYKDSIFITNGGVYINNNLTVIEVKLEKVSYIAGAIAAKLTTSNKLGCIGGIDMPPIAKTFNSFILGAKSINPDVQVSTVYIGSFNDPRAGYEEAQRMIGLGIDVLYGNANATGLGVIKAADENMVYVFGQDSDQSAYSPDYLVASMFQDTQKTYMMVARSILENHFERGKRITVGLEGEHVKLLWNNKVKAILPESILSMEKTIQSEFMSGDLEVPGEQDLKK
jgi:basic membrane lipoprotein Med (substrate-binding protein (PBP1-ABC) superfamily)